MLPQRLPEARAAGRSSILGQPHCQQSRANNGFPVNGLWKREPAKDVSVWPLAGTLIPIPDTGKERRLAPKSKAPDFTSRKFDCRRFAIISWNGTGEKKDSYRTGSFQFSSGSLTFGRNWWAVAAS